LALAALALVVFGAYDSYTSICAPRDGIRFFFCDLMVSGVGSSFFFVWRLSVVKKPTVRVKTNPFRSKYKTAPKCKT